MQIKDIIKPTGFSFKYWKQDIAAGVVVFLVAIPLCVGIAMASGTSPMSGLLSGIIGGLVVTIFSEAPYAVSGPAAGLIGIVIMALENLGAFEALLVAVFLAGIFQMILGILKAGTLAYFIPSSVIKGMLAFIGISLIVKQLPHALGYDIEKFEWQFKVEGHKNIFYVVLESFEYLEIGALMIAVVSFALMYIWQNKVYKKFPFLPAALIVVIFGVLVNELLYKYFFPSLHLGETHLVKVPEVKGITNLFTFPDWKTITNPMVWIMGLTIGFIASLETLLTLKAMDKLAPQKKVTNMDKELFAQGIGNSFAGLLGALPITVVIVRSTTSLSAGGKTKLATFVHGLLLAVFVLIFPQILNLIPLASLAVILIVVGIKLASPKIFRTEWKLGIYRFTPFVITIVASLFTDLLRGILIGLAVGIIFILYEHYKLGIKTIRQKDKIIILLTGNISFLLKPIIIKTLKQISQDESIKEVVIRGQDLTFIDYDVLEVIYEFKHRTENKVVYCENIDLTPFE